MRIGFDGHSYVTRQRLRAIDLLSQQRCDEALDVLLPLYTPGRVRGHWPAWRTT